VEVGWQALVLGIDHLESSVDLGGQDDVFPIGHVFKQSDIPGVYGFIGDDLLVGLLEQVVQYFVEDLVVDVEIVLLLLSWVTVVFVWIVVFIHGGSVVGIGLQ